MFLINMIHPLVQSAATQLPLSKHGRLLTHEAAAVLRNALPHLVPQWYIELLSGYPLMGSYLSHDAGNAYIECRWADVETIISETTEAYPGLALSDYGYLPVATCAVGSGDHLFMRAHESANPAVVQIFHDVVWISATGTLRPEAGRVVAPSLSEFLSAARVLL